MVRLAANLSTMFQDVGFLDRFDRAAAAGFSAVEFMFPYEEPAEKVAEKAAANSLEVVLFNLPAGDFAGGDRGLAALPDRVDECRAGVDKGLEYAEALNCGMLHMMAGVVPGAKGPEYEQTYIDNVRYAADKVADAGKTVLIEAINTRVDIPGYFLDSSAEAARLIEAIDRPNVRFQFDVYHLQIMEGDLARHVEEMLPLIAHIQIADNPGRNEPGTGEINYEWLLSKIDALGYGGWIGCEYKPVGKTEDGLGWAAPYL